MWIESIKNKATSCYLTVINKSIIPRIIKAFDPVLRHQSWDYLDSVLKELESVDDLFFVQIGANDGVVHDPFYRYICSNDWRGILVEPVRCYYDRLQQNYIGNTKLIFENCAISDCNEYRSFYRIQEGLDFMPAWSEGLGSFRLDVLLKHKRLIPSIENYIVEESVECISFETLLVRHAICKVDLLMIDTEGYDFEILKQIDFAWIKPRAIIFEHKHLSPQERRECTSLLESYDYCLQSRFSNTLAYCSTLVE